MAFTDQYVENGRKGKAELIALLVRKSRICMQTSSPTSACASSPTSSRRPAWARSQPRPAELHVSSSAISDAITALEHQLQSHLCVRRKAQGLVLTAAGKQVVARAQTLIAEANELRRELTTTDGELAGPVTIGRYPTLAPVILPVLLAEFGDQHPRVGLEIVETTQDRLAGRLESGEIDVAFVYETLIPGTPQPRTPLRPPPPMSSSPPTIRSPTGRRCASRTSSSAT